MSITDETVEAAANAISECSGMRYDGFWSRVEDLEPEDREYALMEARAALEAAGPHLLEQVWQSAYRQGVEDHMTSLDADLPEYGPSRVNPYRTTK